MTKQYQTESKQLHTSPSFIASGVIRNMTSSLHLFTLLMIFFTLASCGNTLFVHSGASLTPTPKPGLANPYPPHQGTLALNDPLQNNTRGVQWDTRGTCQFKDDGYHAAISITLYSYFCTAYGTHFSNFAYEAQMIILKGDEGGLFFRGDADNAKFYYFRVDQDGTFQFIIFTGHTGARILDKGTIPGFHKGLGQSNIIAVVAQGPQMTFYANHQLVAVEKNTTYSQGQIGLVATDINQPTDVVFRTVKVWTF